MINLDSFFKSLILHLYFKSQESFIQTWDMPEPARQILINTYFITGYMTSLHSLVDLSMSVK